MYDNVGYYTWKDIGEEVDRWHHWFQKLVLSKPTGLEKMKLDIPSVAARTTGVASTHSVVSACENLCAEVVLKVTELCVFVSFYDLSELVPLARLCQMRVLKNKIKI